MELLLPGRVPVQQQQGQEETILQSIETHDPQKFQLQLLDTCRGQATFILTQNGALLLAEESVQFCSLTTKFCMRGGIKQETPPNFLILRRNLKSLQLTERWQKITHSALTIQSQGIPLLSNTHLFIFYYRINVIQIYEYNVYV
jgi:hypothetical protein